MEKENLLVYEPEKNKYLTYADIYSRFTGCSTHGPRGLLIENAAFTHTYQLPHLPVEFTYTVVFRK